jgi:hypothetical protein
MLSCLLLQALLTIQATQVWHMGPSKLLPHHSPQSFLTLYGTHPIHQALSQLVLPLPLETPFLLPSSLTLTLPPSAPNYSMAN